MWHNLFFSSLHCLMRYDLGRISPWGGHCKLVVSHIFDLSDINKMLFTLC